MRMSRRPPRLATLRLLAAIALGGGAYSVYLMACQLMTGLNDKFAITNVPPAQLNGTYNIAYSVQFTTVHGTSPYTWKVVPNQGSSTVSPMPPGLTLDPNGATAGLLHGVPGAGSVGMYDFTIQATDKNNTVANYAVCLTIYFQITPNPLTPATALSPYSVQLSGQGGTGPYGSWSAPTSNPLPSWLSVSPAGVLSGTPPGMGTATFSLQGKDANGNPGLQAETLTIGPALTITTASLPNGTVGAPYANGTGVTLAATGGLPPYTWSFTGSLPSNLSLNPNTGLLSGTPNTPGPVSITVIVTDHAGNTANQAFNFNIAPVGSALTITPTGPALTGGIAGTNYDGAGLQFTASGGSGAGYTWALGTGSGPLPPTLALGPSTGLLSGPLVTAGSYSFMVKVTDGASNTASQPYTIAVSIGVTPSSVPAAAVGVAYSQPLTATGGTGTLTWSTSGSLPSTITLNPSTGVLSGTPANADVAGSPYSFTAKVTDGAGNIGSQAYMLTVALAPVTITTASLNTATVGAAFSQQLAATGGNGTYTWSVPAANLPPTFNLSSGGLLTGNPTTTSGSPFMFTVEAMSGAATPGMKQYTLTVNPAAIVITTTSPLPGGTVGTLYDPPSGLTFAATGGTPPYSWQITSPPANNPPGLSLSTGGVLSGTPTGTGGSYNITVQVTDAASHSTSGQFAVSIAASGSLIITSTSPIPQAFLNNGYYYQFTVSGGTPPYTWSKTSPGVVIPPGMIFAPGGFLQGSPTATGATAMALTVTDHVNNTASGSFAITVNPAPTSCLILANGTNQPTVANVQTLPSVQAGSGDGYSLTLTVPDCLSSDPTTYYGWTVTSGALPNGMILQSGPPTSLYAPVIIAPAGTYNFSLEFTGFDPVDNSGHNFTQAYSLTITP
jgi:hypothetical protein